MTVQKLRPSDRKRLLHWFDANRRDLPWRNEPRDPYHVWVSEIMLQQTRVDTVIPYFNRFLKAFPTVHILAKATEQKVLKLWEGLGYYSRARNLHAAAKQVVDQYAGEFPSEPDAIRSLKGIGPYSVAAIGSLAFGVPLAVFDGNVARVFARYLGYDGEISEANSKSDLTEAAQRSLDRKNPGRFNEAVMELGALLCSPRSPDCVSCPLRGGCYARESSSQDELPVKKPRGKVPTRLRPALAVTRGDAILLVRRPGEGLLAGMWELPALEAEGKESASRAIARTSEWALGRAPKMKKLGEVEHVYSHFKLRMPVLFTRVRSEKVGELEWEHRWATPDEIDELPIHTAATKALSLVKAKV